MSSSFSEIPIARNVLNPTLAFPMADLFATQFLKISIHIDLCVRIGVYLCMCGGRGVVRYMDVVWCGVVWCGVKCGRGAWCDVM